MSTWTGMEWPEKKAEMYDTLFTLVSGLMTGERDRIANLANASSLIDQALKEINWAGFYLMKEGMLVLGPFQGNPACIRIPLGRGVCGTAAQTGRTQLVPDVNLFPGHIACDAQSRSEIVVPIRLDERVVAVMDIDSPIQNRFDAEDQAGLERLAALLAQGCDW